MNLIPAGLQLAARLHQHAAANSRRGPRASRASGARASQPDAKKTARRTRLPTVTVLAIFLAWAGNGPTEAATPPAETRVGALGSVEVIDFAGNQTFSARALRTALQGTPEYLLAAHPAAPLPAYLEAVRAALLRGYRHEGFPDATVSVAANPGTPRLTATVVEGPRYVKGEVRVEGAQEIPAADIVRLVSEPTVASDHPMTLTEAMDAVLREQRGPVPNKEGEKIVQSLQAQTPSAKLAIGAPINQAPGAGANPAAAPLPTGLPPFGSGATLNPFQPGFLETTQAPGQAPWERAKPASFQEEEPQNVARQVRALLADRGHPLASVTASVALDHSTRQAHLTLRIDEGPPAVIGALDVRGHRRNSREDILHCAGLAPGLAATPARLAQARLALWNSARFYTFDVVAKPGEGQSREVSVTVEVDEIDEAPPLSEPLPRLQAALVRFANWMTTEAARREFALTIASTEQAPFILAVSREKGLAFHAETSAARLDLIVGPNGSRALVAANGRTAATEFARVPLNLRAWLWFTTQPDPEKSGRRAHLGFGAAQSSGANTQALVRPELIISPAFACTQLSRGSTPTFAGGDVALASPAGRPMLRFVEETGALVQWNLETIADQPGDPPDHRPMSAQFRSGGGEFERAEQMMRQHWPAPAEPNAPRESFARLFFAGPWSGAIGAMVGENKALSAAQVARAAALAQIAERVLASPEMAGVFAPDTPGDDVAFVIPPAPDVLEKPGALAALFSSYYYQLIARLWPEDTWPTKLARELFYLFTGNTRYTATVLDELYHDPRMGPLGSVLTAQFLRRVNPALSWRFAHRALDHGAAEDFRQDWRLLFDNQTKAGRIAQDLLRVLGDLAPAEIDEFTQGLAPADATAARRAADNLRENKTAPVTDVLRPVLDQWWNERMRPDLENRIGAMMADNTPVDAAMVAFTVNGEPVNRKFLQAATRDPNLLSWVPRRPPAPGAPAASASARALDALVAVTLARQSFRQQGGTIRTDYIDQKIAQELRTRHGGDQARFNAELARQSLTLADHRELVAGREILAIIHTQATKDLAPPTEAEITAFLRQPLPAAEETRHLRAIAFPRSAMNPSESRARAERVRAQARQDGTFERVWAQHDGKDPAGPRRMEFPHALRRDLRTELGEPAFALEVGAVSPVIECDGFFYVLFLVKRDAHDSAADRHRQAMNLAREQKHTAAFFQHLDQLRAHAIVWRLEDPAPKATNVPPPDSGTRLEFETLALAGSSRTRVSPQPMDRFTRPARWSGGRQAFCNSAEGGWAEWEFTVPAEGEYRLVLFATRAVNFCQVQPAVDGKNLGGIVELVAPVVQPTGPVPLGPLPLTAGVHRFRCTVAGRNASATSYSFGLDALDLVPLKSAP